MPRISVLIRAHNEEAHIGRLLTGIAHQTVKPDEIVLVDSGSTDATLAIASAFSARIEHIAPEDFSFGRALNHGLEVATGDIVVLASAHVYPLFDSWLALLLEPFDDESVALSYGRQQVPEDGRFSEQQLLARWFPPQSVLRQRDPFCNNANAAIRRSLWQELPYDEQLTGLEDMDWATRALARGYVLSYVAEAVVAHVHEESFGQVVNRYRREAIAHKRIHSEQKMPLATAAWLALKNVSGDLRDAARQHVLGSHAGDIVAFRLAQFYGTYRGFHQQGPVTEALRKRFYYPPEAEHTSSPGVDVVGRPIDYQAPPPER
ncbi:MAG TPA: glycosyltransferase family A protein [Gaiellaceae bacterium]|nr:glycosyltransferase family A protein [Gaiellaceae bacterium]